MKDFSGFYHFTDGKNYSIQKVETGKTYLVIELSQPDMEHYFREDTIFNLLKEYWPDFKKKTKIKL
jgi:hypothetical protein